MMEKKGMKMVMAMVMMMMRRKRRRTKNVRAQFYAFATFLAAATHEIPLHC